MKKYIRTKDGRVFNFIEKQPHNYILVNNKETYGDICIDIDEILKQADTIEELCDEFVLVDENYCHDFYIDHYYDDMVEVYEEEKERCKNPFPYPRKPRMFYCAIWTDKGLIYVAKMNEKGELELL